jgi:hypothetical protein
MLGCGTEHHKEFNCYSRHTKRIACDLEDTTTLLHEIGHHVDFSTKSKLELSKMQEDLIASSFYGCDINTQARVYKKELDAWKIADQLADQLGLRNSSYTLESFRCLQTYLPG